MANVSETPVYDPGVYQLELLSPVQGGDTGESNKPLKNLANRTAYLKQHMDNVEQALQALASLDSPALTGTPTTPTPPLGDRSTRIANTQFVQDTLSAGLNKDVSPGGPTNLTQVEAGNGVLRFTGVLIGNAVVTVPNNRRSWIVVNDTTGAFTLTVKTSAGTGVTVQQGRMRILWCDSVNVYPAITDFTDAALAGLATSPNVTGGDNSLKIANTNYVFNATDGLTAIDASGNLPVTLSADQAGRAIVNLSGVLTGNINLNFPPVTGQWVVANNTTGAFNVTAKTTAGGSVGVVLPQGAAVVVWGDGTNIYFASASGQASFKRQTFTPAAGTTVLAITGGYTPYNVIVEKNHAWLQPDEFTATTSPNVVLATATSAGDKITVHCFSSFSVTNAVLKTGDTMLSDLFLVQPPDFDNSLRAANTAWINRHASHFPRTFGADLASASNTLSLADAGRWFEISNNGSVNTLPPIGTAHLGAPYYIRCGNADSGVIKASGTDPIITQMGSSVNSILMSRGDTMTIVCNGTAWYVVAYAARPPVGQVAMFAGSTAPAGWIKLNGVLLSRTAYADLFTYAQTQGLLSEATWNNNQWGRFSVGDGSTTFRIPDVRGEFLRAWDDARGVDASRTAGSYQGGQNLSHAHSISDAGHAHGVYDPGHAHGAWTDAQGYHDHNLVTGAVRFNATFNIAAGEGTFHGGADTNRGRGLVQADGNHGHNVGVGASGAGISIYGNGTGIGIYPNGGNEARPRNIAYGAFIKF